MYNNDAHLRRLEIIKNQEKIHNEVQEKCYQALVTVINSFLGYSTRMTYGTFQRVIIDTMDSFGDGTVDLLIEALQEYRRIKNVQQNTSNR